MSELRREDRGRVRVLLLDHPPANTLTPSLLGVLTREIAEAQAAPSVRAIVLGTTQAKYFSAGLDMDSLLGLPAERRAEVFRGLIGAHRALASCPKPVVAAMRGYALLGGFILALGCDFRLLSEEHGRVALSEIRLGISPTTALITLVSAMTGRPGLIKELVLHGKTLRAPEALDAGLVDKLVPSEAVLDSAVREAEHLAKIAPKAYASVKAALRRSVMGDEDALWDRAYGELNDLLAADEAKEGLLAMKEKRRPRWE